jgi:thymidylate synthase ThyX
MSDNPTLKRRIYPLDPRELSQEELAVVFAMTSRRAEGFDEIRDLVNIEKAADFNERWVLGYGHSSVAEHAVLHIAFENISRLACDTLEDNRLASYTEKSSRYQIIAPGSYHVPSELLENIEIKRDYLNACDNLFATYEQLLKQLQFHLSKTNQQEVKERNGAYGLRLRREAIDTCRFILPAATLTNVGVTMNARSVEHAVRKLLSSELMEEQAIGSEFKEQAQSITPTLIRYAEPNVYLKTSRSKIQEEARKNHVMDSTTSRAPSGVSAKLISFDNEAESRLAKALLYRNSNMSYEQISQKVDNLSYDYQIQIISSALSEMSPHDAPVRELEQIEYTFELLLDYGAYREFKRHRMQSYLPQPLHVGEGFVIPPLIEEANLLGDYKNAIELANSSFDSLSSISPRLAEYIVTHGHIRRVLTKINLRECYALFKLRVQNQAHFTIQSAMTQALQHIQRVHPSLIQFIQLRQE